MGKVIFVMVDALGFDTATKRGGYLEHLTEHNLAAKYKIRGELPSASRPMYETLMTGLPVYKHGVVSNAVSRPSRCKNLFSLCKENGLGTAAAAFLWISELYNATCPFNIYEHRIQHNEGGYIDNGIFYTDFDYPDSHLYSDGDHLRKYYKPDFLLIHPMVSDTVGHRFGCESKEYQDAADHSLQHVAYYLDRWVEDGYDVIVTADHAIDELGIHGGNADIQRTVPLYIVSDKVKKGDFTDHTISNLEIAPFVCRLLGIEPAEGMKKEIHIEMEQDKL